MAARGHVGRPEHVPTRENKAAVTALAALEHTHNEIARYLRIDLKTLRKHYKAELATDPMWLQGVAELRLAQHIRKGNLRAILFFLRVKCGWKLTEKLEHELPDGTRFIVQIGGPDRPQASLPEPPDPINETEPDAEHAG